MEFERGTVADATNAQKGLSRQRTFASFRSLGTFGSSFYRSKKDVNVKIDTVPGAGEESAGFVSRLFFWWVNPMVTLAYNQTLEQQNLWGIQKKSESTTLADRFEKEWETEMQKPKGKRSLFRAMLRFFRTKIIQTGLLNLSQNCILLVTPVLIRMFLQWVENDDAPLWRGYMLAGLMFLVGSLINGILSSHMFIQLYTVGMDIRTVLNATVYRKSLNLSNTARQTVSTGEVVTYMSNDAEKLPQSALSFHNLWVTPIFLVVAITMLVQLVGYSALGGVLFLCLSIPLQGKLAFKSMVAQRRQMKQTDSRVKLLNEIMQGIKIVKFYAWEASFKERVDAMRNLELVQIKKFAIISAENTALLLATPYMMVLITLLIFFGTGGEFKPDIVFTAVALLFVIRFPLFMLPMAIAGAATANVSLKRMQRFLELDEISEEDRIWENRSGASQGAGEIEIKDGLFTWTVDIPEEPSSSKKPKGSKKKAKKAAVAQESKEESKEAGGDENTKDEEKTAPWNIEVPSLKISGAEMVAVVGMVGSGKSSLVSAMLGEMTKKQGEVRVKGSVAYVAQTAWIINGTVKENILMGRAFDEERYERVIEACSLTQDLDMLEGGDNTEIGEKGINLSGGQKQRVSLARAAYADADIYILDDPLSAVDAHVGRHIFERLLLKMLSSKTIVVCTNQLHFLPQVSRVLVLKEGKITEIGTFEELMSNQGEFSVLMETFEGKEEQEQEEETKEAPEDQEASAQEETGKGKREAVNKAKSQIISKEGKSEGSVKWRVFKTYLVEGTGGWKIPIFLVFIAVLAQGASNVYEWFLSYWSESYVADPDEVQRNKYFYMFTYFGLAIAAVVFVFIRGLAFAFQGLQCSRHLHKILIAGIIRAPASFFDTTPIGRILNRFSKDMDNIDLAIPRSFPLFIILLGQLLGNLITMILVLPWFAIPIIPIMMVYNHIQKHYRPVSRDLQRLESISRSPIFAQFSETLSGVSTLRAFDMQDRFISTNEERLDSSNRSFYIMHCCNRWLQLRLELIGGSISLVVALLVAASKSTKYIVVDAGIAGLLLTYSLQITGALNFVVRMACETESRITSAERIKEYSSLKHEAPEIVEENRPATEWPAKGEIVIKNLSMRYRQGLDLVLRKVSLTITGGEKVGIAGRTGSGKSSLMMALFRIVEPADGTIFIDGMDIQDLGLKDLRSALSIIPQDPVMFCGSLRENLDPFEKYDDKVVWDALRAAHLHDYVSGNDKKLEMEISEGGENLSLGQRQLVCLARAILRRNKILVMDEATANIDMETDALIQQTIRTEFKDCTVLTIAHRLHTIMDCDKILIMDAGTVGEFDHPSNLLAKENSLLTSLVEETGARSAKKLKDIANGTRGGVEELEKGPGN